MRVISWKWESEVKEREKKCKIINARATVTMHICMVTVALVHKCKILHLLMWVFFLSKCVKWSVFSIVQDFASTDVDALTLDIYSQIESFEELKIHLSCLIQPSQVKNYTLLGFIPICNILSPGLGRARDTKVSILNQKKP